MHSVFAIRLMKHTLIHSALLCLLIALPTCSWADISHNFQSKTDEHTLVNVDATHVRSTTDDIVYTFGGTADCYKDWEHRTGTGGRICLNLLSKYDNITISPAIDKLSELTISYSSNLDGNTLSDSKISIQLSKDGSNWTSVTPTITYSAGFISVVAPSADAYYVKIRSLSSTKISILQIDYIISDCNCFTYTIE